MNEKKISNPMDSASPEGFTLGRPLDITYLPNKILFILLPISFIVRTLWSLLIGKPFLTSLIFGVIQLLVVFLSWAIARELDPNNDYAAFIGLPLLFLPIPLAKINILLLFWFLLALRSINQTSGRSLTSSDVMIFFFFTFIASLLSQAIFIIPLSILFLVISSLLPKENKGLALLSFPLIPLFVLFFLVMPHAIALMRPTIWTLLFITGSSLLFFFVIFRTTTITCVGDQSGILLSLKRVQSGQILGVLSALIISTFHGGINLIYPVWTALIGIGIYHIVIIFRKKPRSV